MNLTTVELVKTMIAIPTDDTSNDTILDAMIASVSQRMEQLMNRKLEVDQRIEDQMVSSGQAEIALDAFPVFDDEDFIVTQSSTRNFTDADEWTIDEDYTFDATGGVVFLLRDPQFKIHPITGYPLAPAWFRITYTGGLASTTDEVMSDHAAIADACATQVRYMWQRKDSLGGNINTTQGGTSFTAAYDLLASVKKICEYHRRTRI